MPRVAVLLVVFASLLSAANVRLYLKDGSDQLVREYEKKGDRVRYYSVERADWEEIPLALVDLKRTEDAIHEHEAESKREAAEIDAEEKAERAERDEIARIPVENGVYLIDAGKMRSVKQAESKTINDRKRSVLKAVSPIPIVAGKASVELEGTQSATQVTMNRPEFYIRLANDERFGIIRLNPTKTARVVEKVSTMPVTKELVEEMENVEIFRKQIADGLYKIWPTKPLTPGEYAVVEYTEGKGNIQVWDFSYNSR